MRQPIATLWIGGILLLALAGGLPLSTTHAAVLPSIGGVQLHYDGDVTASVLDYQGDTPDDGMPPFTGNVKRWVDQSGNGYTAVAGGSHSATFAPAGLDGAVAPSLRFIGNGSRRMTIDNFDHGGDETIFAVFSTVTTSGQIFNSNGTSATTGTYVFEVTGGKLGGRVYSNSVNHGVVTTPISVNTPYIGAYIFDDNTSGGAQLYLNGAQKGTANTNAVGTVSSQAILGNHPISSSAFQGDLAELLIYDRALTIGEHKQVGMYLEEKYGIATSYADHADDSTVSINFYRSNSVVWTHLPQTAMTGVAMATNWNNIDVLMTTNDPTNHAFPAIDLLDATGQLTGAKVSSSVDAGYDNNNGNGNTTPDHTMMNASIYYNNNGIDTGTVTLEGLAAAFPTDQYSGYDVYLYFDTNANNRTMTFTLDDGLGFSQSLTGFEGGVIGDSTTPNFVEATADTSVASNYMVFRGLTLDAFDIIATSNPGRAGIAGIQLVGIAAVPAVPEPSTWLLALLGVLGAACLRRRRGIV